MDGLRFEKYGIYTVRCSFVKKSFHFGFSYLIHIESHPDFVSF